MVWRGVIPIALNTPRSWTRSRVCSTMVFSTPRPATDAMSKVSRLTRTALTLSARTVRDHHEKSERLSVRVTPQYAGPVPGTVIVTAGRTTVCMIRLRNGAGACQLSASKLRPGTYHLVARYSRTTDFAASASRAARAAVLRVTS